MLLSVDEGRNAKAYSDSGHADDEPPMRSALVTRTDSGNLALTSTRNVSYRWLGDCTCTASAWAWISWDQAPDAAHPFSAQGTDVKQIAAAGNIVDDKCAISSQDSLSPNNRNQR